MYTYAYNFTKFIDSTHRGVAQCVVRLSQHVKLYPVKKLRYWHYIPAVYNIQSYTKKSPQAKRLRSFINYNLVWYLLDKCDNCHPFVELIQ